MVATLPPLDTPSRADVRAAAKQHFLELDDEDLDAFVEVVDANLDRYRALETLPEVGPAGDKPPDRESGNRPAVGEDPYNAFITRCRVGRTDEGPLTGTEVGVKDNIAVAGIEMTAASSLLAGYVPNRDATVVDRLLEAGATIVGKTNMDDFAASGTGDLAAGGPTLNPHDAGYVSGGSSGGSAVAVVTGDVDVALGTDQAGSVRVPAAWCGCVGLKPTYGLVPYTGAIPSGVTYDHCGPLARTVEDCATVLEVIAGPDPLDPRQSPGEPPTYAAGLDGDAAGLVVGVLAEGFGAGDAAVDAAVRGALERFEAAGAELVEVSVPWHEHGGTIRGGITGEAGTAMSLDERVGHYHRGGYDTQLLLAYAAARRDSADAFPPTVKANLLTGQYLMDTYHGYYHAKAQNLRRELASAYDDGLAGVDVLAMPTVPSTPLPVAEDPSWTELLERKSVGGRTRNTAPFCVTGHPAISVPCGEADDLPVGLMFVGERFDDATALEVAYAFEQRAG